MSNFDLPSDILNAILRYATSFVDKSIFGWRDMLPLLAVCSYWRTIAKHILYSQAIIEGAGSVNGNPYKSWPTKRDIRDDKLSALSNFKLLGQNGTWKCIKHLAVIDSTWSENTGLIYCMSNELLLTECDCPDLILPRPWPDTININVFETIEHRSSYLRQINELAALYAYRFPEVTSLQVVVREFFGPFDPFMISLLYCFISNLKSLEYLGPPLFPYTFAKHTLQKLSLHIYYSDFNHFPEFIPETLQSLSMVIEEPALKWKCFRASCDSKLIEFGSLTSLNLVGGRYTSTSPTEEKVELVHDLCLRFPILNCLRITNLKLNIEEARCMLQAPLKQLYFTGEIDCALQLCRIGFGKLDMLSVYLVRCRRILPFEKLTPKLNTLFCGVADIPIVRAKLYIDVPKWGNAQVYWPNLTHLTLNGKIDFDTIFRIIPAMPDLIYLILRLTFDDLEEIEYAITLLNSVQERYFQPSSSGIKALIIYHSKYVQKKCISAALRQLKWYLPNLESAFAYEYSPNCDMWS